jgi:hypothetical protein
MLNSCQYDELG